MRYEFHFVVYRLYDFSRGRKEDHGEGCVGDELLSFHISGSCLFEIPRDLV